VLEGGWRRLPGLLPRLVGGRVREARAGDLALIERILADGLLPGHG